MANFEIFAKGPPFALWPKSPILSTLQKICHFSANSCCFIEILVSVETRINSASIHTNQAKTRLVLTILQPFKVWPKKWPISRFLQRVPPLPLSTLQKNFSANSCCFIEILVSVETRINSASIHTNQAKTRLVLTILQPFKFQSVAKKMANFEILAKGPPFALWPKSPILSTLQKICHFSANSCCFIEILVSVETRINSASIHTNQAKIRLVLTILQPFKVWPKKWPISRFLQRVPPLHFGQNRPF